ncbi:MAG: hypothetical protein HY461_03310 [Parcubacteria group bacterium]|nr:hypothetical protein [Parcubacteria group bacterium]
MAYKYFGAILLSLALLGAGCSFQPLTPADDTDNQTGTQQPADEPSDESDDEQEPADTTDEADDEAGDEATDEENGEPAESEDEDTTKPEEPADTNDQPSTGTSYGGKVISKVTLKPDANSVIVFLNGEKDAYKGSDGYMEIGCGDVLVPVRRELTKTQSDLAHAIVELLTIKEKAYADQGLSNTIAKSKVRLTNIHYDGKTRVIDFEGEFVSGGTCDDPRIKAQIEETVKLYSSDYRIQLNGSETGWKCLGDQSGTCA